MVLLLGCVLCQRSIVSKSLQQCMLSCCSTGSVLTSLSLTLYQSRRASVRGRLLVSLCNVVTIGIAFATRPRAQLYAMRDIYNSVRDIFFRAYKEVGVTTVQREPLGLYSGTNARPADLFVPDVTNVAH